ncbi:bifunctional 2-polyprenyl-6-hydroxyphenol methylase/3-demethylubiquinol 3-O-methyltransferase UbiG [Puniceibacterium sp. IMCC21224]|uniref:class I SAM-dependent methyltransferase n=1 Tax=Puniceibacterium sp. IMCC21224 TaxID=1618204 RepID=UPI00064E0514|nr:class I SAM-dependent methyltransferase [Puniceibacterium sp. IMCC21224]KMK68306.1 Methyltransferase domain [Puniceibacterium sp. IMCC21224]
MTTETPKQHWDEIYRTKRATSSGTPSAVLVRVAEGLTPGRSLDLGSSNGDDVIWLAQRGWRALGLDISPVACDRASARAETLGLGELARFQSRDLGLGLPDGEFDLITALYFQSHVDLPRAAILRAAAGQVAPDGHLLVVSHAAPPPWATPEMLANAAPFPTVASELADVGAEDGAWHKVQAEVVTRPGKGPDNASADLQDNVILLRKA